MVDKKEVDAEYWMGRCYELWKLLDDIDTAGDIAKSDDKLYRAMAERHQAKRWNFLEEGEVNFLYDMFHDPAFDD